jgi:flagellar biosynthesis GTPase FlhF
LAIILVLGCGSATAQADKDKPLKIGDEVKFKDSTWVVLSAREVGDTLKSSNENFADDLHSEDGKYIYVKFKVTNERNEQDAIAITPAARDSKGRRYEELEQLAPYLQEGEKEIFGAPLPAGLGKTFVSIFEMPKDSEGVVFLARSLDVIKTEKAVVLDLEAVKKREAEEAARILEEKRLAEERAAQERAAKEQEEKERMAKEQAVKEQKEKERMAKEQEDKEAEIAKIDERLKELKLIRDQDVARINQLTNFKRTPVREGTREYQLCLESSQRIQVAENEARTLIEKKKELTPGQ